MCMYLSSRNAVEFRVSRFPLQDEVGKCSASTRLPHPRWPSSPCASTAHPTIALLDYTSVVAVAGTAQRWVSRPFPTLSRSPSPRE
jgi:hypothetical protein